MNYEWLRSPAFWLVLAAPLFMVAAFHLSIDIPVADAGRGLAIAAAGLTAAGGAGAWLAVREQRLRRLLEAGGLDEAGGTSLSAAQAATYRDLFENATDIVFTTDLSGHFLAGNKAVQRLLGYTVEEAKSLTWERLVAPYDMWKARQMYKRHAGGETRISFELDTVTASGEIKTFEIGSRPMFREGRLCGFHGIARDVTSRKEMQQQLEAARREAESANESKSTFLANMSHEIRTPINGMLGFLSLFAKTGLTPRQKEYLVPVEASARHLLKIINDILDLSKIEAGRFSIDNEIFNFREVVTGAVEILRPLGETKGLEVRVGFDPRIPRLVVGDGTRIGQVVSNLVSNAIKFTDAGFVAIQARVRETTASQVTLEVAVTDSGIGIAPEHQAILFEPFRQVDASPERRYAGTGLGLTISRNLVEAMGGGIRVYSEPSKSTEVVFDLPLGLAPDRIQGSTGTGRDMLEPFTGRGLRALVVDDNEINRRYLKAVLDQYGVDVACVDSGGAALEACRARHFDVVFMDIHMADMDGIETTRRLRAQVPAYRAVPVVAVSADVMGDSGIRFTGQGLDRFVAKPVREKDLTALLAELFPERAGQGVAEPAPDPDDGGFRPAGLVLDSDQGIALASGDELLWRCSVDGLRSQIREAMPRLEAAVASGDRDEARALAHKLAGSAGYVAANELAVSARALQQSLVNSNDNVEIDRRLAGLGEAAARFVDIDVDATG